MSIENLFLTQQMRETQRNLENRLEEEEARQRKGGLFSSVGSGLGGFLGGIGGTMLGAALAPITGGLSLAATAGLTGLGATAGSLAGSRVGLELGDGKRSDAVDLGMNRSAVTGEEREFGQDIKDRYRRGINDFQDSLNNRILSSALQTGIKAAAFAYGGGALNKPTMAEGTVVDASGNIVDIPKANVAGAQAYQPASMGGSARINASQLPAPSVAPRVNPSLTTTTAPAITTAKPQPTNLFDQAMISQPDLPAMSNPTVGQVFDNFSRQAELAQFPNSFTGPLANNILPNQNNQLFNYITDFRGRP